MILESRSRGQPLLALVLMLAGWVGARAFAWEHGQQQEDVARVPQAAPAAAARRESTASSFAGAERSRRPAAPPSAAAGIAPADTVPLRPLARPVDVAPLPPMPFAPLAPHAAPMGPSAPETPPSPAGARIAAAGGHHALWLAATALLPLPPLGLRETPRGAPGVPPKRWSADGWLLLRPNPEGKITPGPLPGTYGASQAGAVIRYRLDSASARKPSFYTRAAAAIGKSREHEAALGLSARPLAALPLVAMIEARINESRSSAARVRPAVAVVTELPPQRLPAGFTGEVYAQAGWVGGRSPTAFIDGLMRAERPVAQFGPDLALHAGGGAWGAKQRGASRLDLGPIASLRVRLGDSGVNARIEADWRLRVSGRSRPESGPVLTVAAGF